MAQQVVIPTTGAVTLTDADGGSGSTPPEVVGDPPQWADDSDGSYAELETFEHPDSSLVDNGIAALATTPDLSPNPTGVTIYGRIRYQSLNSDMAPPRVLLRDAGSTMMIAEPAAPGSGTATTVDIPLALTGGFTMVQVLERLAAKSLTLVVTGPFLRTIAFRRPRTRVFEASLVVETPSWEAPPCRLFPREDGLGVGSGRHFPPPKSQQRSGRRFGYY